MGTECGFERWKLKNPNGTLEEYQQALKKFRKDHPMVGVPQVAHLPNGLVVPLDNITPAEASVLSNEHLKSATG